jgi:hypothetical protein
MRNLPLSPPPAHRHTHPADPQAAVLSLMVASEREHDAVTCAEGSTVCVYVPEKCK